MSCVPTVCKETTSNHANIADDDRDLLSTDSEGQKHFLFLTIIKIFPIRFLCNSQSFDIHVISMHLSPGFNMKNCNTKDY